VAGHGVVVSLVDGWEDAVGAGLVGVDLDNVGGEVVR
jgi:hypothetical protein